MQLTYTQRYHALQIALFQTQRDLHATFTTRFAALLSLQGVGCESSVVCLPKLLLCIAVLVLQATAQVTKQRVLVTGGLVSFYLLHLLILERLRHISMQSPQGFIGSHVVEELISQGYDVTILDDESNGSNFNPSTKLIVGDVAEIDSIAELHEQHFDYAREPLNFISFKLFNEFCYYLLSYTFVLSFKYFHFRTGNPPCCRYQCRRGDFTRPPCICMSHNPSIIKALLSFFLMRRRACPIRKSTNGPTFWVRRKYWNGAIRAL
jgi:hypothetical protein